MALGRNMIYEEQSNQLNQIESNDSVHNEKIPKMSNSQQLYFSSYQGSQGMGYFPENKGSFSQETEQQGNLSNYQANVESTT